MNATTRNYGRAPLAPERYPFPEWIRAVSVRMPWSWLLAAGWKDVENRSWKLPLHDGPRWLAVHAGRKVEPGLQTFFECDLGVEIPIATCAIVGAVLIDGNVDGSLGSRSPWYAGESGWTVAGSVLLAEPIEGVLGSLGTFQLQMPVLAALERAWPHAEHRTRRTAA